MKSMFGLALLACSLPSLAQVPGETVNFTPSNACNPLTTYQCWATDDPTVSVAWVSVYQPFTVQHSLSVSVNGKIYGANVPFTKTVISNVPKTTHSNGVSVIDFTATNAVLNSITGDGSYVIMTTTDEITTITPYVCSGRGGCSPHPHDNYLGGKFTYL